ncbi:hypothetical protein H8Z72_22575 (plasmid) [Xanthomonas citri pv. citri]|uniref:hypothetical protein n=1 Tax=Xanthomonas citri TaxID=346 RepID=UPI0019341A86|nr:hypothetical protein [Xanthomonas citri]QRD62684.1 hypothetical protein H8Z74_23610 [Xanthomonas citri pv. citri]QRD67219.1 hypothetical protein H8Z73_22590 [Xanthomonas citri pv. citri]QRD71736.1 hypothetical protein H8Z72_22575 [Xanthomonas citri pv. citri]
MTKLTPSHHVFTDAEAKAYRGSLRHLTYTRRVPLVLLGTILLDASLVAVFGTSYGANLAILVTVVVFLACVFVSANAVHVPVDPLAELDGLALGDLAKAVEKHPEVRTWIHDAIASGKTLRMRDYVVACAQANALDAKASAAGRRQADTESRDEAWAALLAAAGLPDNRDTAHQQQRA